MARNRPITYIAVIAAFIFFYSYLQFPATPTSSSPSPYNHGGEGRSFAGSGKGGGKGVDGGGVYHVSADTIHGEVIMPKLGNETLKYEISACLLE